MSAAWIGLAWRKEQRPFALFSQVKAEESRLDFLLALSGYSPTNPFPTFVAVEIDGWTYHGRDDEQAIARDHLRDVALLTSFGVPTVRLMASMLRAQPAECGDLALAALIEDHIKRSMMIDAAITIHENTQRSLARRALVDAARSGVATAAQMEAGC